MFSVLLSNPTYVLQLITTTLQAALVGWAC
jgi:hypothetical protein